MGLTEGDVEDEKRVCVGDVWRSRPAEVRHLLRGESERKLGFAVQKEGENFLEENLAGVSHIVYSSPYLVLVLL